ncbi:MAG: hypothetical protein ABI947_13290 [Chloroflexota bacterium]
MRNIRVFVSSPGDLKAERQLIADLIESFSKRATIRDRYKFTPFLYERFAPAVTGEAPQVVVNEQMLRPSETDIVICILWSRFGTPLAEINPDTGQPYDSGTEFEFYEAYRAYQKRKTPTILLYRCTRPVPEGADPVQVVRVNAFFKRFEGSKAPLRGLYKSFDTAESLRAALTNDIDTLIARWERPSQRVIDQILRPIWPVAILLAALMAILLVFMSRTPGNVPLLPTPTATPIFLKSGLFNVAVAPFNVAALGFSDTELKEMTDIQLTQTVTEAFVSNFKVKLLDISAAAQLTLWLPDVIEQVNPALVSDDNGAQMLVDNLNQRFHVQADLVIYGVITRNSSGKRVVRPGFYVTGNHPELVEVKGRFDLDSVISVGSLNNDNALKFGLASRAQVIAYAAYGLSLMAAQHYQTAIKDGFDPILAANEADQSKAPVVIYVLKGSASLGSYNVLAATSDPRAEAAQNALNTAENSFRLAFQLDKDYARAALGLASTHYLRLVESGQTDEASLKQVIEEFERALVAKDQPPSAAIPTKVAFGRGQVLALLYAQNQDDDTFKQGNDSLTDVINGARNTSDPQLEEIVARAYALRGSMAVSRAKYNGDSADYESAITDYESAGRLSKVAASQALYHRRLIRVQFDQALTGNDPATIEAMFRQFVTLADPAPPAEELAEIWRDKGRYYRDNDRHSEAAAAFNAALSYDLSAFKPQAAGIWFDLGGEYDTLCQVEAASQAYQQTIRLDGSNPNYQKLPGLIHRYALQSCF